MFCHIGKKPYLCIVRKNETKHRNMTNTDKNRLISDLEKVIDKYADSKRLFCGGCCFAAAVLADILSKKGIRYEVVIFQMDDAYDMKSIRTVCNSEGCAHIAILVTYKGRKHIIGDCERIYMSLSVLAERWRKRTYRNISPDEIMDAYMNNTWNPRYDKRNNPRLTRSLRNISEKYANL